MFLIYFIYYSEKEVNLYLSNFNDFFYSPISAVAGHTVADHIEVVRTEVVRTVAGFVVFESAAAGYLQGHLKYMT